MPHRSFDASTNHEEVTFTVGDDPYVFRAAAQAPAHALMAIAATSGGEEGGGSRIMESSIQFLDTVLMPESREHFASRLSDPSNPITLETIGELVKWLVEAYSARPTAQPSPSAAGQSAPGTSSMAPPSSMASTS